MPTLKQARRDPVSAAPQMLSALILALNAALDFQREFPKEMAAARGLFKQYDRELSVMLGSGTPQEGE